MWRRLTVAPKVLRAIQLRQTHSKSSPLDVLVERGFVRDVTRKEQLNDALQSATQTIYAGVDPTANSLHIGHLIPLMCLLHFQIRGHKILPLIGGATGLVGDPSGRLAERQLADVKQVEQNVIDLTSSISTFFERATEYAASRVKSAEHLSKPNVLSNLDWHGSFGLLDFLQQVGIHARVNTMMNRENVRARLTSQHGLSFTEFTYQLLQAYDFYYLNRHHGCTIQVGGSDQWGNIVAGLELINKIGANAPESSAGAFGITTPLLTTSTGEKFGKSAGNAVWLNPDLTSVFDFYQYFLKVTDTDVEKYLKLFTLLPLEEIGEIVKAHHQSPEKRLGQHKLASEATELVHSREGALRASTITKLLFASNYEDLNADDVLSSLKEDPRLAQLPLLELVETPVGKLTAKFGLTSSNSASKTLISSRGLYLNNQPVPDAQFKISQSDLIENRVAIIRAGKDKLLVLAVV